MPADPAAVATVVLAGGRSSRLGGRPKAALHRDGRTLLSEVVSAAGALGPVVVVAPETLAAEALDDAARAPVVAVALEDPPFGGPVAGIAAGIAALPQGARHVVVLACDLPRAAELVAVLGGADAEHALADADVVAPVDAEGFRQLLAARYRVDALRDALAALDDVRDVSVRRLTAPLSITTITVPSGATDDVDDAAAATRFGLSAWPA